MIGSPNSSFIPKQDSSAVPNVVRRRRVFSFVHVVSTVAVLVSLVVAGGAYFYKEQLTNKKNALGVQLAEQRKTLSSADIAAVQNFDRQHRAAVHLIDNHLAPSRLFEALERSTLARVEYSSFEYENTPGTDAMLNLTGITQEFSTIALQAQAYQDEPLLQDAFVTELSVMSANTDAGAGVTGDRVSFDVEAVLDLGKLRYDGSAPVATAAPAVPAVEPVAVPPSPIPVPAVAPPVNQ